MSHIDYRSLESKFSLRKVENSNLKSLDSSETREEFALPTFTMCNYQAHSKHKIQDLYPFVRIGLPVSSNL